MRFFADAYIDLKDRLEDAMKKLTAEYSGFQVHFTGHSLGGAVAIIAAATMVKLEIVDPKATKVYTYGQPRAGDYQFSEYIDINIDNIYRVVHENDSVANIPYCSRDE